MIDFQITNSDSNHFFSLLHAIALTMADLAWLHERLASDDEETEAMWDLLTTMHQQNVHYKLNKGANARRFTEKKRHLTLIVHSQKLMIGSGGTTSLQILCIQ
jgi:hypothetical protein